eukprot:5705910-Prymnesium_polylepis.1
MSGMGLDLSSASGLEFRRMALNPTTVRLSNHLEFECCQQGQRRRLLYPIPMIPLASETESGKTATDAAIPRSNAIAPALLALISE